MAAAVLILAAAQDVRADPVRLGDGSAFFVTDFRSTPDRSFDNWGLFFLPPDLVSGVSGREVFANARQACQSCAAGDVFNPGSSFELRGPSFTSNGVWGVGRLNFHAPDAVVPEPTDRFSTVTTPFDFDGYISLDSSTGLIFEGAIFGSGFTRVWLWDSGDGVTSTFHQQQYWFGPNGFDQAPVPEPATLLLCGTGLAWAVRRRIRQKR